MAELGSTGLKAYNGIIQEDFLREWRLPESYKRANEMRLNSPVLAGLLAAIDLSIAKIEMTLSSDDGENDPRLELWKLQVDKLQGGLGNHIREALTFLPFGFSLHEIVWSRVDNYVIAGKLAPRGQDTVSQWLLAANGDFEGFVQQAAPRYSLVTIPGEKLLLYRFRPERNNPEGRSILRSAWLPYYYAKNLMQIEAIGIERDLAGLPVIKLPEGADTNEGDTNSDASKAAQVVRNIRQDEQAGIVLPYGWELELLSSGGSRQFDTDKIISRYESRMLMSALAQFLILGQDGVGSFSLSKDQTDLFTMSVNATADIITDTLQAQLLPRLMRLNGYDAEGLKLTHSLAGDTDLVSLADFLQKVNPLITWTVQDEMWLRQAAGLPEIDEDALTEEREMNRQLAQAMRPEVDPEQQDEEGPEADEVEDEEDTEQLNAQALEFFAARPDAAKRRRAERSFQSTWQQVLARMKSKVITNAKESRNA